MPTLGYTIRGPIGRSGRGAGPTLTILSTRNPLLSNGGVNPRKSTVPRSYWIEAERSGGEPARGMPAHRSSGSEGFAQTRVDAIIREAQGGALIEQQPNSPICFVCGIDNPIGLDEAPSACT
jgi:hypothetical protein